MPRSSAARIAFAVAAPVMLAACGTALPQGTTPYRPTAAMDDVLAERLAMHAKERSDVVLDQARDVPSLVDAANAILNVRGLPAPGIEVSQISYPVASGAAGRIGAVLYRPALAKDTPIILYFPGGTWATRSDAAADETARQLVTRTGFVVLSLQPRLAPEAKFPAIHDDALAGYQWARAQMRSWGADPTRVILAGEGPGANLALSTALAARDQRLAMPDALLLITPWAGTSTSGPSMRENGDSQPLTRSSVRWAQNLYADDHLADPRIDLARRSDLAGLPPTLMLLADIDPLRSDAEALATHLQQAGDRVDVRRYGGVTYDFFGLGASVPTAAVAEDDAAHVLKARFATTPASTTPARTPPVSRSRARR
ncbi:MAG: alpha/beta hydrolase [Acetobacteraceae bacterium]|nr:alpha/beta hydrolase [Acetobacteraceae bacterium]